MGKKSAIFMILLFVVPGVMAILLAIILSTCHSPHKELQSRKSIGPQFYAYELPEYEIAEHDVMYGLGGRWITVRNTLKEGIKIDPKEIRNRISKALEGAGWEAKTLPTRKYVLSKIIETSPNDLYYSHGAFPGDPPHWFYSQAIHISADGGVVVLYCEVGWWDL